MANATKLTDLIGTCQKKHQDLSHVISDTQVKRDEGVAGGGGGREIVCQNERERESLGFRF